MNPRHRSIVLPLSIIIIWWRWERTLSRFRRLNGFLIEHLTTKRAQQYDTNYNSFVDSKVSYNVNYGNCNQREQWSERDAVTRCQNGRKDDMRVAQWKIRNSLVVRNFGASNRRMQELITWLGRFRRVNLRWLVRSRWTFVATDYSNEGSTSSMT